MSFILAASDINNVAVDTIMSALLIILTLLAIIVTVWLLVRNINIEYTHINVTKTMLIVVGIGVLLRFGLSFVAVGNRQELYALYEAAEEWSKYGPGQYIARYYFQTGRFVYPLQYFYAGLTAGSMISAGISASSPIIQFVLKLPFMLADVCSAFILYKAAVKYLNKQTGVILAGFVMLCPLFIFASSIWGSAYSVLAALLLGSFYAIVEKKYAVALIVYGAAMLWIRDSSYLFPMYAVYFVYIWAKQLKVVAKGEGNVAVAKKDVISIPLTVIGVIVVQYVICLPLMLERYSANFFQFIYQIFIYPLNQFEFYSNNALSIYNIFGKGGWNTDVIFRDQRAPYFVAAFAIVVAVLTIVIYMCGKNRAVLTFTAAFSLFILHTTYFDFSITSLLPVIILLLMSFILIKDKRILKVMFAESILMILMMVCVFVFGGYLNNLPFDVFTSPSYTGSMQITSNTFGIVVAIGLSVLSIANLVYMTLVVISISMSEKRSTLGGNEKASVSTALKYFIKK